MPEPGQGARATGLDARVEIAPGVAMPVLGLGTYKSADGDEVRTAVAAALELGYRGVDTASLYGNEAGIGLALAESGVPRDQLFVATKVWNDEQGHRGTLDAARRSLERLGLDYVDAYLVHWPMREHLAGTWAAMQELLAEGLTRSVGVCNFLPHHLQALAAVSDVAPAIDQVEHHPFLQRPDLTRHVAEAGIVLQAWAPVMRGHAGEVPELRDIAARHGKTPAQVCLRWILQHGHTTIPKSVHTERIRENADVFDFELTHAEMSVIDGLDRGERYGPDPDTLAW